MRAASILAWVLACALAQAPDPPYKFGTTVVLAMGLKGQIYHIKRDAERLPDFRKLKPVGSIYTASLNVPPQSFQEGFPGVTKRFEWFAIDYTGRFWISRPGPHRFSLLSDDGSRLYLDDHLIIDNDGQHAPREEQGEVTLAEGIHRMRVSYFQGPRFHVALVLKVAAPGDRLRVFSTDNFKPPPDAQWTDTGEEPRPRKRR